MEKTEVLHENKALSSDRPPSSEISNQFEASNLEDPLNWPLYLKFAILLQVSILGAVCLLSVAIANPTLVELAKDFNITTVKASYQATTGIAVSSISPALWIPISNSYGRRPVYLVATLFGMITTIACAYCKTFPQLIALKFIQGLFPAPLIMGAVTVVDLFPPHQRGRAMGVYTLSLASGAHLAPLLGGLIGQFLGWRWTQKFSAIVQAFMLIVAIFGLPETLYVRRPDPPQTAADGMKMFTFKFYASRLGLWYTYPELKLRAKHFFVPCIKVARYPSVFAPALYYGVSYGFSSILPAVTMAQIFHQRYGFNTLQVGLGAGGALLVGSLLGELAAGIVLDAIFKRERRKYNGGNPPPEARLKGIWTGTILMPAGLLIYGFSLQYGAHWAGPLFGLGIACFGLQVISTACFTYSIDCYLTEGLEISQVFCFARQAIGMTFAFYAIPMGTKIGYQWTFLFFAISGVLAFIPVFALMLWGEKIRHKMGKPSNLNAFDSSGGSAGEVVGLGLGDDYAR